MPKIRIFETDSTGITSSDVAIVFVPGNADLKENVADANGCVYIPSTYSSKVGTENDKYFTKTLDEIKEEPLVEDNTVDYVLFKYKKEKPFTITKENDVYIVKGDQIEKLFRMTKFTTQSVLAMVTRLR